MFFEQLMKKISLFIFSLFFAITSLAAQDSPLYGVWKIDSLTGVSVFAEYGYAITDTEFKYRNIKKKEQTIYPYHIYEDEVNLDSPVASTKNSPRMESSSFRFERPDVYHLVLHVNGKTIKLVKQDKINDIKHKLQITGGVLIATGIVHYAAGTVVNYRNTKALNSRLSGQKLGLPGDGGVLGNNMEKVLNTSKPANTASHHIVAKNLPSAQVSRQIMQKYGIDINDARNGVWLPTDYDMADKYGVQPHVGSGGYVHSNEFQGAIAERMVRCKNASDVVAVLDWARNICLSRSYTY